MRHCGHKCCQKPWDSYRKSSTLSSQLHDILRISFYLLRSGRQAWPLVSKCHLSYISKFVIILDTLFKTTNGYCAVINVCISQQTLWSEGFSAHAKVHLFFLQKVLGFCCSFFLFLSQCFFFSSLSFPPALQLQLLYPGAWFHFVMIISEPLWSLVSSSADKVFSVMLFIYPLIWNPRE